MGQYHSRISHVKIKGYKSFCCDGADISFGDITVLLGPNGSGKSNLISFFRMINYITTKGFTNYVGMQGGASSLLYYGPKNTEKIDFEINVDQEHEHSNKTSQYEASLTYASPDRLFFSRERIIYRKDSFSYPQSVDLETGGLESGLKDSNEKTAQVMWKILSGIRAYQFHDTSSTSRMKTNSYVEDATYLRSDAGNIASFLKAMKENVLSVKYYDRIERHIQKVMPQFSRFDFYQTKSDRAVMLNWYDVTQDTLFGPHQLSDGSLRFIALAALLLQPPDDIPSTIIIDEPELGLHPAAISELASMIRTASKYSQIIIATQSTRLVDEFGADNIVIVERENNCTNLARLDKNKLSEWLDRYSMSELWEKNVLGGRP